ncbi:MAG: hypothetical protein R3C01_08020 [Planctomycetaceae bacterium]
MARTITITASAEFPEDDPRLMELLQERLRKTIADVHAELGLAGKTTDDDAAKPQEVNDELEIAATEVAEESASRNKAALAGEPLDDTSDPSLQAFLAARECEPDDRLCRLRQQAICEEAIKEQVKNTVRRGWNWATTLNAVADMLTKLMGMF